MPSNLGKNINLCFIKLKFPSTYNSQSSSNSSYSSSSLLTPDGINTASLPSTSTATASSYLIKNYNSLYESKSISSEPDPDPQSDSEPDFATVFASQRFFFTSPGSSNSIIEPTAVSSSIATTPDSSSHTLIPISSSPINTDQSSPNGVGCDQPSQPTTTVEDRIAVRTLSPNPYIDFRRSMQEMVEARGLNDDVKANREYLQELLLCYLALNPKGTHKFITRAFADLLVSLMAAEGSDKKINEVNGEVIEITDGKIPAGQCM